MSDPCKLVPLEMVHEYVIFTIKCNHNYMKQSYDAKEHFMSKMKLILFLCDFYYVLICHDEEKSQNEE